MEPQPKRCLPGDGQPGSLQAVATRQGIPDDLACQQALEQLVEGRSLELEQKILRQRWLLGKGGDLAEGRTAEEARTLRSGWGGGGWGDPLERPAEQVAEGVSLPEHRLAGLEPLPAAQGEPPAAALQGTQGCE